MSSNVNIKNRKASFEYDFIAKFVAGISLVGTEIKFTTISGKLMKVKVRAGTQPNTQIKLTGQGMPITDPRGPNQHSGKFGDQIILLKGMIPVNIEQGVIDAITKYKDIQDLKNN